MFNDNNDCINFLLTKFSVEQMTSDENIISFVDTCEDNFRDYGEIIATYIFNFVSQNESNIEFYAAILVKLLKNKQYLNMFEKLCQPEPTEQVLNQKLFNLIETIKQSSSEYKPVSHQQSPMSDTSESQLLNSKFQGANVDILSEKEESSKINLSYIDRNNDSKILNMLHNSYSDCKIKIFKLFEDRQDNFESQDQIRNTFQELNKEKLAQIKKNDKLSCEKNQICFICKIEFSIDVQDTKDLCQFHHHNENYRAHKQCYEKLLQYSDISEQPKIIDDKIVNFTKDLRRKKENITRVHFKSKKIE